MCVEALKHEINAQSIANSLKDTRAVYGEGTNNTTRTIHNTPTQTHTHMHTHMHTHTRANIRKKLKHINLYEVLRQATAEAAAASKAATPNKNCPKVNFYFHPTSCAALFVFCSHLCFGKFNLCHTRRMCNLIRLNE